VCVCVRARAFVCLHTHTFVIRCLRAIHVSSNYHTMYACLLVVCVYEQLAEYDTSTIMPSFEVCVYVGVCACVYTSSSPSITPL
jgi:hypothetical protein